MKRKNKIFRKVIIVLAVLALLTGCAGQEPEAEDTRTPTDDNLIVVGVSQEGSESVWRTANTRSVKETLTKENGYFLIFKNARQKQENQIKAIRSFIASDVDVISFCPIVETGWDTVLQEAKDAGIPVVLVDRGVTADPSLYVTHIFADALKEGDKVQLVGFGSFEVKKRAARIGRNPKTKESIEIPASVVPVFKAGKALKDAVAK